MKKRLSTTTEDRQLRAKAPYLLANFSESVPDNKLKDFGFSGWFLGSDAPEWLRESTTIPPQDKLLHFFGINLDYKRFPEYENRAGLRKN